MGRSKKSQRKLPPNVYERVARSGEIRYQAIARWSEGGRMQQTKATFATPELAAKWAERTVELRREKKVGLRDDLESVASAFLRGNQWKKVVPGANSTRTIRERHLERWKSVLGRHCSVLMLGTEQIIAARNKLQALNQFHPRTVNLYLTSLRQLFQWAIESKLTIDRINPVDGAMIANKQVPKPKRRVGTDQELRLALEACAELGYDDVRAQLLCFAGSGGRRHEVMRMEISRLDLERGTYQLFDSETKGDLGGHLRFRGPALEALREQVRTGEHPRRYVWPSPVRRKVERPKRWSRKKWKKVLNCAGLTAPDGAVSLSPHSWRHWHVTAMLTEGAPARVAQLSVRHANISMTESYGSFEDSTVGMWLDRTVVRKLETAVGPAPELQPASAGADDLVEQAIDAIRKNPQLQAGRYDVANWRLIE